MLFEKFMNVLFSERCLLYMSYVRKTQDLTCKNIVPVTFLFSFCKEISDF